MDFNPPQLSYLVSGYLLIENNKQCQNVQDVKRGQKNKLIKKKKLTLMIIQAL